MAFATSFIVQNFIDRLETLPIELAPVELQEAAAKASKALIAEYNREGESEEATVAIPLAEAKWAQEAELAVRDGQPLPSKEEIERAIISKTIAEKEHLLAIKAKEVAYNTVARLLGKEVIRDQWRANIEKALLPVQQGLRDMNADVLREVNKTHILLGTTRFLGEFGEHYFIPDSNIDYPSKSLQAWANQKPFIPGVPFEQVNRFQQEGVVDDRPTVFIVNSNGGIHDTTAAKADEDLKQVGWRLATPEEISYWYRKQGLPQPV